MKKLLGVSAFKFSMYLGENIIWPQGRSPAIYITDCGIADSGFGYSFI